jgi:hypothetical protein
MGRQEPAPVGLVPTKVQPGESERDGPVYGGVHRSPAREHHMGATIVQGGLQKIRPQNQTASNDERDGTGP